jgi:alkylation response protein AidB-like acyl-CoA dehydrogenase
MSTAVLATSALLAVGGPLAHGYLARIAVGELIATVAVSEAALHWDSADVTTVAQATGSDWTLSGVKPYVLDGAQVGLIIVAARTGRGISLFAVESGADGLTIDPLDSMDQTRRLARLTLDRTPGTLLGADGSGWDVIEAVNDRALAALACEQVGGARAALEMTVAYVNMRQQFDRPIGSFQAIKHRCADLLVEVESARSAAYAALGALAAGSDELPVLAAVAKAFCSDAFLLCAGDSIQLHGGIGFTWEHSAHLYFKRAKASQLLFGDPAHHRHKLAGYLSLS